LIDFDQSGISSLSFLLSNISTTKPSMNFHFYELITAVSYFCERCTGRTNTSEMKRKK